MKRKKPPQYLKPVLTPVLKPALSHLAGLVSLVLLSQLMGSDGSNGSNGLGGLDVLTSSAGSACRYGGDASKSSGTLANWALAAEAKNSKPENHRSENLSLDSLAKLYNQGRYLDSAKIAQKLIDQNPKNLTARYYLGNSYLKLGLPHEALNQYSFCVNFGKGTQIATYAQEAIGGINDILTGAEPKTNAGSATARGSNPNSYNSRQNASGGSTGSGLDQTPQDRNYTLKTEILTRGSQKIEDLKAKFKEDLKRLQKEFESRTASIPPEKRPTPGGMKAKDQLLLAEDPQTRRYLEALDLQEKTSLNLSSKLAEDIDRITSECKRQVEALDSGDPHRLKMSAGSANVRDYVNYGDSVFDTIPDQAPLTARAKALTPGKDKDITQVKNQAQGKAKSQAQSQVQTQGQSQVNNQVQSKGKENAQARSDIDIQKQTQKQSQSQTENAIKAE
ncbi:MAG: hypothetical protein J0M35_09785 [Candidatus Obscuribacter phosphatis]|uniref:Tetratricopeptide repeat protein n=1 Tax=Candidatus Obscuribacter phosphatis TaxID=1906157 RepID=A0A8J7PFX7_9BACT|nr:hypothetical protein [Candidatus Obscuribacter phosphatis]